MTARPLVCTGLTLRLHGRLVARRMPDQIELRQTHVGRHLDGLLGAVGPDELDVVHAVPIYGRKCGHDAKGRTKGTGLGYTHQGYRLGVHPPRVQAWGAPIQGYRLGVHPSRVQAWGAPIKGTGLGCTHPRVQVWGTPIKGTGLGCTHFLGHFCSFLWSS